MTKPDMFKPEYEGERRRDWLLVGNLTYLMALEAAGLDRCAGRLVDKIAVGIRREPIKRVVDVTKIELPDEERGRSARDIARLDQINARLAKGYKPRKGKSAEDQRDDDLRARDALEREIAQRAEEKAQRQRLQEIEQLASVRGERVTDDRPGVKRIIDRDPLLSLFRAGVLTDRQLEAGQAVRDLYDLRMGDAASAPFDGAPAGTHDHERFVGVRFLRAKAAVPASQLEMAILTGHYRTNLGQLYTLTCWPKLRGQGMEPHVSLAALRWVCCEHNTLTSMGRGRAYDRNRKALCWALDVADEVLDGRAGARAAEVAAKTGGR